MCLSETYSHCLPGVLSTALTLSIILQPCSCSLSLDNLGLWDEVSVAEIIRESMWCSIFSHQPQVWTGSVRFNRSFQQTGSTSCPIFKCICSMKCEWSCEFFAAISMRTNEKCFLNYIVALLWNGRWLSCGKTGWKKHCYINIKKRELQTAALPSQSNVVHLSVVVVLSDMSTVVDWQSWLHSPPGNNDCAGVARTVKWED